MRTGNPRAWMAIGLAVLGCAAAAPQVAQARPAAVAVGGNGTAYFAYDASDTERWRVQDRWVPQAGALSAGEWISPAGRSASEAAVDAGATGGAVHVWVAEVSDDQPAVLTRRRAADGRLGPVVRISPPGTFVAAPAVAVDAAGNAVYAWLQPSATGEEVLVRARRRTAAGLLSPVQSVTVSGRARDPRIEVDADGDAVISWLRQAPDGREYLQARARAASGTLSPAVQNLSATTADVTGPSFAVAPDGQATFAWIARQPSGTTIVHTRTRAADGTLSATQNLTPLVQNARATDTAVDANGNAVFTWSQRSGVTPDHVELRAAKARARTAAGTLGTVKALSAAACNAGEPRVAMAADATAVLAWTCSGAEGHALHTVRRQPGGTYGEVETVVTTTSGYLNGPELELAPDGTAWLSWLRGDTATHTLYREARSHKPGGALGDTLSLHSYLT